MSLRVVTARVYVTQGGHCQGTEGGHCQGVCHSGWSLPGCMSLRVVSARVYVVLSGSFMSM